MPSTTLTVRVDEKVRKRLEKLAKSTARSRSFLAAEAIEQFLDANEWQVAGIRTAIASLDAGAGHDQDAVKAWVESWDTKAECPPPAVRRK